MRRAARAERKALRRQKREALQARKQAAAALMSESGSKKDAEKKQGEAGKKGIPYTGRAKAVGEIGLKMGGVVTATVVRIVCPD